MGELYRRMERDLALKNMSAATQQQYLRSCHRFARYHMKSHSRRRQGDARARRVSAPLPPPRAAEGIRQAPPLWAPRAR